MYIFYQCLLSTYYGPGAGLDAEDTMASQTKTASSFMTCSMANTILTTVFTKQNSK